ncbi:MAG TPA: TonB-dependent receptor [Candidatus Marinimicrobia bacterium]|nr:TonB-dependent receptor [Candidatus Neomarinimicrobiota bacterium]
MILRNVKVLSVILPLLVILISSANIMAQPPAGAPRPTSGRLSGTVLIKNTDKPIEYAAITLHGLQDSSIITGTITNEDGIFILDKIPFGRYFAKISFIGYKTAVINNIAITPPKPEVVLGTVYLEPVAIDLSSVTVTGEKKALAYNLDKKVITIDNSVGTIGGTATDIMQTIPSVTVDIDGNVSLRGSSSVTLLVDSRPSQIISLDEIPASMVERVEVITNPSARYDPEGMSGIINIVLKKKRSPGYNGMLLVNAGTGGKYNGSINLNYRYNKFNLFANYDMRMGHRLGTGETIRESIRNDSTFYLNQYQNSENRNRFHNIKLGGDYFINDYNTISLSMLYNLRSFSNQNNTEYLNTDYNAVGYNQFTRLSYGDTDNQGQEYGLFYKKTFPQPQREWTIDLFYSTFSRNSDQSITQQAVLTDSLITVLPDLENIFSDDANRVITARTDYVHPIGEHRRIEAGYRGTFRHNDSDYRRFNYNYTMTDWFPDSLASNHYIYDANIHAVYGIYSRELGRLQSQLGLRIEQFNTNNNLVTIDSSFQKNYFSMFPTIHFRYALTENQGLQVSYSRRVHRPHTWQVSPFVDYSDPYNLSSGNPKLKPEYIDVAEIEHSYENRKTSINTSLFYRQVNGMITRLTELQEGGITFTTYQNLNNGVSYGIESVISHNLTPWWRINTNISYFNNRLYGTGISIADANESHSWNARVNSFFRLGENTEMQIMLFYFSPTVGVSGGGRGFHGPGQGRMQENYFVNLGAKHNFLDGKMSAFVRVSDIFKTQKHGQTIYGDNFKTTSLRHPESQVIFFGISYKINEGIKERQKRTDEENEYPDMEEM